MGRKFSFNLAPIKVPLKPDKPAEPSPAIRSSHARHASKDSIASVNMTYISRQRIDPRTEQELRAACALILQNFKPSDHDMPDADPKLDFRGPGRRTEQREPKVLTVKINRATGAPPERTTSHNARRDMQRIAAAPKSYPDLPLRANTGMRKPEQTVNAAAESEAKRPLKSPTTDAPRQALARADTDTDDAMSVGTPLTANTETHMFSGSTAPTSVAVTHVSSKRTSHQGDNPAAVADAQAAEWMRRQHPKSQSRPQTSDKAPSRSTSIRSGFREYMFPGSRNLSRAPSQASLRSQSSSQPKRSGSVQGWRSWGLHRSGSRSSSRPGTSSGRKGASEHEKKGELNLNRELPPLPSLDTWKEPEPPKEQPKAPVAGTHIATLMRTQDRQQNFATTARQHHRRSGSDTLALRYKNASNELPPRIKALNKQAAAQNSSALSPEDRLVDFDHMMSAMSSSRTLDEQLQLNVNGHSHQHSSRSIPRASADGRLASLNFSRKISTDTPSFDANEFAYPNVVKVVPAHASKPEQKSKLKKVFSAWTLKKEKKSEDDWMHKIERDGVKTGVMTQHEAALPPVVRY